MIKNTLTAEKYLSLSRSLDELLSKLKAGECRRLVFGLPNDKEPRSNYRIIEYIPTPGGDQFVTRIINRNGQTSSGDYSHDAELMRVKAMRYIETEIFYLNERLARLLNDKTKKEISDRRAASVWYSI